MAVLPHSGIEYVDEGEASGEIASVYEDIRRIMQIPFVPNLIKALSASTAAVHAHWNMYGSFLQETSLPISLVSMILYAVAQSNECRYCSAMNELSCRTLGIDEDTLQAMARDLERVTPERLRAIIEFSVRTVHFPQEITPEDFDALRVHGLSDEEIIEVIVIAAVAQFNDILSDALRIDVDDEVVEALAQ